MISAVNESAHARPSRSRWVVCAVFLETVFRLSVGLAQAAAPITPSGLNTQVNLSTEAPSGTVQYNITGGSRAGTTLFHSFGDFSVPNHAIANFLNTPVGGALPSTSNILGRITGDTASNIFGTIQTTGFGDANLFLMNPAGIVFGPNASLLVGGSVHFTTADYLRLTDGAQFNAVPNTGADVLLSTAAVSAFGFLGSDPGTILVHGSHLSVADSKSFSLVGGNITIQGWVPESGPTQTARLSAPNGQINLASTQSAGEFLPGLNGVSFRSFGSIHLASGSTVDVGQTRNGEVSIRNGQLALEIKNAVLTTADSSSSTAVTLGQDTIVLAPGSSILSQTSSGDQGPNIQIIADRIQLFGSLPPSPTTPKTEVKIATLTEGRGNGGRISLRASTDIKTTGVVTLTTDSLDSPSHPPGNAGDIEVTSLQGNILLTKGTRQASTIFSSADSGNTGNIRLSAPHGNIVLERAGLLTQTFESGRPGKIEVDANNLLMHAGLLSIENSEVGTLKPEGITVTLSGTLRMEADPTLKGNPSDSVIATSTVSKAPAGDINIAAKDIVLVQKSIINSATFESGPGGNLTIVADTLQITDGSQISSGSTRAPSRGNFDPTIIPTGPGGNITIQVNAGPTGSVIIDGAGSGIFADTESTGAGGSIALTAGKSISVTNGGTISASSTGPGNAGNITITGNSLTVASGGQIEASTSSTGKGGSIGITTTGDLTVTGLSVDGQVRSGIFAKTLSGGGGSGGGSGGGGGGSGGGVSKPGKAGDITIETKNLLLNGGAQIDSSTTSGGAGGSVSIKTAENITIAGSSTRLTSDATHGNGKGGSLTLVAKNITVRDKASVTAATGGKGDAGDISLTALDQLLLQSAGTVTTSTSGSGKGGTIVIQANQVLLDGQGTRISADTLPPFADMIITIKILHPNVGDLVVQLESPTGTRVALLSRVGGSGANFIDTQLNDRASTQITSGSAPFTGTFTPREPLGQLNNELAAGDWVLNIRDQATNNVGSLESWMLQVGNQTFQSTGGSRVIPDNGNALQSTITVANPTVPTVQGVGETLGIGGNIVLTAGQSVTVSNGASVSASSTGSGNAGNLFINAGQRLDVLNGTITTQAAKASGGNIDIRAIDQIRFVNSTVSTSVLGQDGKGGNIFIDPKVVVLQGSTVTAEAVGGTGGQIKFVTPLFLADSASTVSAQSQRGPNGTVTIQSPTANLSGAVGQLVSKTSPPQVLLQNRCVALAGGEQSTFILTGRNTLPVEPGGWLSSPVSMEHWTAVSPEHASTLMVQSPSRRSKTWPAMVTPRDETQVLALRRLTPPGFLVRAFATPSTGCPS